MINLIRTKKAKTWYYFNFIESKNQKKIFAVYEQTKGYTPMYPKCQQLVMSTKAKQEWAKLICISVRIY